MTGTARTHACEGRSAYGILFFTFLYKSSILCNMLCRILVFYHTTNHWEGAMPAYVKFTACQINAFCK